MLPTWNAKVAKVTARNNPHPSTPPQLGGASGMVSPMETDLSSATPKDNAQIMPLLKKSLVILATRTVLLAHKTT